MDTEVNEVVDLVHSLVLQSRSAALEEASILPAATPIKINFRSTPSSPALSVSRSETFPVRKKVQIKSAPLKPPDLGNSSLFPSVEESLVTSPSKRIPLKYNVNANVNVASSSCSSSSANEIGNGAGAKSAFSSGSGDVFSLNPARDKKLKTLEAKLTEPRQNQIFQQQVEVESPANSRRASLNELTTSSSTPSRKTPRSAKLYSELSSERRQKLDELAEKYSKSLDKNQCRNVLDEMEFLFQLFNSSSPNVVKKDSSSSIPLLSSAAEQAYFVIKVVINQMDKLLISMPTFTLQLIVDNYPHKIPKPVRKHLDDWILLQRDKPLKSVTDEAPIPVDLAKTVTFQSEKDGRSNFLQQTDFHAFCKQRDLFYAIRETWSNSNNNSSSIITDRSKARMSFPPVNANSNPRFADSLPFKVQSLFQMNQSPTNLFHMASLFVSHYLLEARAQEVGGLPKDDNMKEFFQSNPAKLLQLNSRFSTSANETLESEQSTNLAFQKQFLLASSPKFVQHVVDRLVMEISQTEQNLESVELGQSLQICRIVKDTVHLAKLLGFSQSLPYLTEDSKGTIPINSIERESILQEQVHIRSYQSPPLDLKHFLEKAWRCGRLIGTCPWILEYLLQCDSVTLQLPSYQAVLASLLSIYKTVLVWKSSESTSSLSSPLSNTGSSRNFLRFYFGLLFSSKNFPDSAFSLQIQDVHLGSSSEQDEADESVDSLEDVANSLTEYFFQDTFNRFKRILSWGKLQVSHPALTGEFRHIRPIPASEKVTSTSNSKSSTLISKEKLLQSQLEATFFELYSPSMKRSVDFIAERMASNFVQLAKCQFFPNLRILLASQGIFGVRAAEKCRTRLGEEMAKYLSEKCSLTVKLFLEQSVTSGVLGLCQRIAIRKAKESGHEWIRNYIGAAMFPEIPDGGTGVPGASSSSTSTVKIPPEDPPFEVLILMHRTLRKLHSRQSVDPQLIDKVLSCQTLSKCPWAFVPLLDWGLGIIAYQPQCLNVLRMGKLVSLWKGLWMSGSSGKIINARNLVILNHAPNPRDSWIKLGSITQLLISEGLVKADNLEEVCMSLLREEWPEETHKRISEYLTIVLEAFHGRQEWHSESAQVLDWVAWLCSGQPDQD